jgi:hypothetical protein
MKNNDFNKDDFNTDEVKRILEQAEKSALQQQSLPFEDEDIKDEFDALIQNPEEAYNIYYKTINKLLREHFYPLLKGTVNQRHRQLIYDQKNLLLNFGKEKNSNGIRGADGRMTTTNRMQMVAELIMEWVTTDGKSTFNLFTKLRDKNVELGYIK